MPITAEILHLPVSELAKRIQSKAISPVDLTKAYLDRSEKLGPQLNAYARLTPETALAQADAAEKEIKRGHYRGPLHGIPYAAKDLLATKGVPTTWGARPYENQVFDYDATVIEHLRRVGAILIGKAAMIELAGGMNYRFASASLQGAAKNPWDTNCWTCGSSSGSGAIVAAGLAAFAIGTETWGSIICPSAFCGVSGLRPTYGRVSRYGAMALAYQWTKSDRWLVPRKIVRTFLPRSRVTTSRTAARCPSIEPPLRIHHRWSFRRKPLRIGLLANAWKISTRHRKSSAGRSECRQKTFCRQQVRAASRRSVGRCRKRHHGVEGAASFPHLDSLRESSQLTDPLGQINGYVNESISAADYVRALQSARNLAAENGPTVR